MSKFLFFLFISCSSINPGTLHKYPGKTTIILKNKEIEIDAGTGYFWDSPVYNKSKTLCIILKNEGNISNGWNPHSIIKISSEKVETVLVNSDLNENWTISEIFKVSEDGNHILVKIHSIFRKELGLTHFKTRPVILDIPTKKLIEIKL